MAKKKKNPTLTPVESQELAAKDELKLPDNVRPEKLMARYDYSYRPEKLACTHCSFRATSQYGLVEHTNAHSGNRPFKCNECQKTFGRRSALWNHRRLHLEFRPFRCRLCPKKYKWKRSLQAHMIMHAKKAPTDDAIPAKKIAQEILKKIKGYASSMRRDKKKPLFNKDGLVPDNVRDDLSTEEIDPADQCAQLPAFVDPNEGCVFQFESEDDRAKFNEMLAENQVENAATTGPVFVYIDPRHDNLPNRDYLPAEHRSASSIVIWIDASADSDHHGCHNSVTETSAQSIDNFNEDPIDLTVREGPRAW